MYKTDTEGLKLKECPGVIENVAGGNNAGGNSESSH
jgi:hypothetical protein